MQGQMPGWWAEHWAVRCMEYRTCISLAEMYLGALYLLLEIIIIAPPRPLPVWVDFEVFMQEVAVEEHCWGRKGGTGNKQNRLHVLKMYVTCCCSASVEWELTAAQELSGFMFGQRITQFKDDKCTG